VPPQKLRASYGLEEKLPKFNKIKDWDYSYLGKKKNRRSRKVSV
jgi:hypothetical protein